MLDNIFKSFENEYQSILISSDNKRVVDNAVIIINQDGDIVGKVSCSRDVTIPKVFNSKEYMEKKMHLLMKPLYLAHKKKVILDA